MNNDPLSNIHKIIFAVYDATSKSSNGWVRFTDIAKLVYGAWNYDTIVKSYTELPEAARYFRVSSKAVMLTSEGFDLVHQLNQSAPATTPSESRLRAVVEAVRRYAGHLRPQHIKIQKVLNVAIAGSRVVYAVHVEIEENAVPVDAPITLYYKDGTAPVRGRLVAQEPDGLVLYIAFESHVAIPYGSDPYLIVDRSFLLAQLADALERMGHIPKLGWNIWRQNLKDIVIANGDSIQVAKQILALRTPWTRFLWGPPGAGKTYSLCHFIVGLLQENPNAKILLVAPANLAVDVATLQLLTQLEHSTLASLVRERKILRFGYPRKSELLERPELLGPYDLDHLTKEVKRQSERVAQAEVMQASDAKLAVLRAELLETQENLKTAVCNHVAECNIVTTTTTLAYMPRSPISQIKWNTVLIDEATMVPTAICVFLSSLTTDRLLFAGDPQQLGPVYEEQVGGSIEEREYLGQDIFQVSALSTPRGRHQDISLNDGRLVRITSQRRCTTKIWQKVEFLYPSIENRVDETKLNILADLPPAQGEAIVLLDTGAYDKSLARCQPLHNSWRNTVSAELSLEVASAITSLAPTGSISVAIITPYRAQVGLLRKWIREETRAGTTIFKAVDVGTVHQFQGSEADIVIFDLVDGYGRERIGQLLRGNTGLRLVNVALTRARGKVVLIANRRWFVNNPHHEEDNPILWSLINGPGTKSKVIQIKVAPPIENLASKVESPIELLLLEAMHQIPELSDVEVQYTILEETGKIVSRADFAFPKYKFAIYCDGAQWHLKPDRWQKDLRQRNKLQALGWRFNAFSGYEINQNVQACVAQVLETLRNLKRL